MQHARGLLTEDEVASAPTVIVHRGHLHSPCASAAYTQAAQYAAAIQVIEDRGERPTARAVLLELGYARRMQDNGYGTVIDNGMGGRELNIFAVAMDAAGYHRVPRGKYNLQWTKEMR
jgi:hypothetical protein